VRPSFFMKCAVHEAFNPKVTLDDCDPTLLFVIVIPAMVLC
jgi:hypothetical protein